MKAELQGTAHIAKYSLHKSEVRGTWCMHVQTELLHCIGNIRARQSEILKSAG